MEAAGKRLGLEAESRILRKALEFERLLKLKYSSCGNINDSTKAIICLEFAANLFNIPFDKSLGVTLAGVQKSNYEKYRSSIGNLLNIKSDVNIKSLCVQLGCTSVREVADDIYNKFEKKYPENQDWNRTQVACMAVFLACKIKKCKVPKNDFLSYSHLKSKEWSNLKILCDDLIKEPNNKLKSNQDKYTEEFKENRADEINKNGAVTIVADEPLDYELWKESVLKKARMELTNCVDTNDGVRLIFV